MPDILAEDASLPLETDLLRPACFGLERSSKERSRKRCRIGAAGVTSFTKSQFDLVAALHENQFSIKEFGYCDEITLEMYFNEAEYFVYWIGTETFCAGEC